MKHLYKLWLLTVMIICFTQLVSPSLFAQTSVAAGNVSGSWLLSGSPYNVNGDITVPDGSTLTIAQGVTVNFQGHYKFNVQGRVIAVGTVADTITFTAVNTTTGWCGFRFEKTPITNDSSKFIFCKIVYGKANGTNNDAYGGAFFLSDFSKEIISSSLVSNNNASSNGGGIYCSNSSPTISGNTFNNNSSSNSGAAILCDSASSPTITNNSFSNNIGFYVIDCIHSSSPLITSNVINSNSGGAIACTYSSFPVITNNTISNNAAFYGGGGIYCYISSSPTISNNIITNNSSHDQGGGIYCGNSSSPNINDNTISNNTVAYSSSSGGGIYCNNSSPTIKNNTITYNSATGSGGGIACVTSSSANIIGNFISNNIATGLITSGGGVYCSSASPILTDNIITNNTAAHGGGIYCGFTASPKISNTTIVNNTSSSVSSGGGGLYCQNSSNPILKNVILFGNTASSNNGNNVYLNDNLSDPLFSNSDVEGSNTGFYLYTGTYTGAYTNNINTNPLFVSPSGGAGNGFNGVAANWSLLSSSPCIDAGAADTTGLSLPTTDIAGNPRITNSIIDMGAYEYILNTFAIIAQPVSTSVCSSNNATFSITATLATSYHWQESTNGGTAFNNLSNVGVYSTVGTPTLAITGAAINMDGFQYRCIVSDGITSDTSSTVTLHVSNYPNLVISNPPAGCTVDITGVSVVSDANATTGTVSYWTDAAATIALTSPSAITTGGTYYIKKITTSGACSDIKPVVVTVNPNPNIHVINPVAVCSPAVVDITTTFSDLNNTTGTVTYWQDAGATISIATPSAVVTGGTYYIKKTSSSAGSCSDIKPVTVTINAIPNLAITNPAAGCTVNITTAGVVSDGNNTIGTLTYWTDAGATISLTNPTAVTTGGTYYIKKTTTAGSCADIKPVTININPIPNLNITNPAAVCSPGAVDITAIFTDLNVTTGTITYWTNAGATISLTTPTAVTTSGTYYIKKITTTGGCADIKPVTVTINTTPTVTVNSATICAGQTANITAIGGTTYVWSNGANSSGINTANASPTTTSTYTVTGTTSDCSNTATSTVTVHQLPTLNYIQTPSNVCINNSTITLSAASPAGGTYSGAGVTGTAFNPTTAGSGTHLITYSYTDNNSCTNSTTENIIVALCTDVESLTASPSSEVNVFPNPFDASFTISGANESTEVKMYNLLGAQVGLWKIENKNTTIETEYLSTGIYFIELKNENGIVMKKIIKE
jgi:parallel beta-helix repeat protein